MTAAAQFRVPGWVCQVSGQTAGYRPEQVDKILQALQIAQHEVDKIEIKPPSPGMLGGNVHANALFSDMHHATKSLTLWCSMQSKSLAEFGRAIESAKKAITDADDDSAASANIIRNAVDGVTREFYKLTGKDTRATGAANLADSPGIFGALGKTVEQLQWDAEINK